VTVKLVVVVLLSAIVFQKQKTKTGGKTKTGEERF
jgi:hypothetical protein